MTNEDVLKKFERELDHSRDCSPNTIKAYRNELRNFIEWLAPKQLLKSKRDDFLDYKKAIGERAPAGIRIAIAAIRGLYLFLDDQNILRPSPFPLTMTVKGKRQEPTDVPTAAQFIQTRARLDEPNYDPRQMPIETRRVIVELLAGAGLRIQALLTLKPKFCRFGDRPIIMVEADEMACKGNRAGEIPVSPYAAALLLRYIQEKGCGLDDILFDYTECTVRRTIKRLSLEGLDLHPHTFRHFYCSMTYFRNFDGGKNDIVWTRDAVGHSSISTTDGYVKMARRVCQDDTLWETWAHGHPKAIQEARTA